LVTQVRKDFRARPERQGIKEALEELDQQGLKEFREFKE
jgi:hypothetical protein